MTAVDRALRYIEKLMASRPVRAASAKATPRPTQRRGKRPEPAQRPAREPYVPPVTQPDVSALVETFAPAAPVSVEWAMGGGRLRVPGGSHPPQRRVARRRPGSHLR